MRLIEFPTSLLIIAAIGGSLAIIANMLALIMIGKINERAGEKEKVSYIWWGSGIIKQYRGFYPASKLPLLFWTVEVLLLLTFLVGAWLLNLFLAGDQ